MKKIIYFLFAVAVSLSSCLDENPEYSLNSKTTFEDINTARLALSECYAKLTTYNTYGQASQELLVGASGLAWSQTNGSDQDRFVSLDAAIADNFNKLNWTGMYESISSCNFFIENIKNGTLSDAQVKYLSAQAKFVRGIAYFNLLTTNGGVPLRNLPVLSSTLNIRRALKEDIENQIETDWKDALDGLQTTERDGYASRYAAHAYLAKLYWYLASQENNSSSHYWSKAKAHCDSVLLKGNYKLEPNFANLFVNNIKGSKEAIFQLNFTTQSLTSGNRGNWLFSPQNSTPKGISWGRIRASKSFHDWFKGTYPDDPRYNATFLTEWTNYSNGSKMYSYPIVSYKEGRNVIVEKIDYSKLSDPTNPKVEELSQALKTRFCGPKGEHNGWPFFKKAYDLNSGAQNSNKNIILYRYADFLLLMADVENELGNTTVAINLVNEVLSRARNSATPSAVYPKNLSLTLSADDVRKRIYEERLFELAGEPSMYMEVRRRGVEFMKPVLERHNNHHITYSLATSDTVGVHRFRDRIFNNGNISNDFLKKNLLLPIPQDEINGNELMNVSDQNFGY